LCGTCSGDKRVVHLPVDRNRNRYADARGGEVELLAGKLTRRKRRIRDAMANSSGSARWRCQSTSSWSLPRVAEIPLRLSQFAPQMKRRAHVDHGNPRVAVLLP